VIRHENGVLLPHDAPDTGDTVTHQYIDNQLYQQDTHRTVRAGYPNLTHPSYRCPRCLDHDFEWIDTLTPCPCCLTRYTTLHQDGDELLLEVWIPIHTNPITRLELLMENQPPPGETSNP